MQRQTWTFKSQGLVEEFERTWVEISWGEKLCPYETRGKGAGHNYKRNDTAIKDRIGQKLVRTDQAQDSGRFDLRAWAGLPRWCSGEEFAHQCRRAKRGRSLPGWDRSLGVRNGDPLQQCCLENTMDRGAWRATAYGVTKSRTQLHCWAHTHTDFELYYTLIVIY